MAKATDKVHLPQADGEVAVTAAGRERRVWQVQAHLVSPRTADEQAQLLRLPGARLATKADLAAAEQQQTTA